MNDATRSFLKKIPISKNQDVELWMHISNDFVGRTTSCGKGNQGIPAGAWNFVLIYIGTK